MKGYSFLMWAYNVVWIGLVVYLAFLVVRVRRVSERLDRLERKTGPRS